MIRSRFFLLLVLFLSVSLNGQSEPILLSKDAVTNDISIVSHDFNHASSLRYSLEIRYPTGNEVYSAIYDSNDKNVQTGVRHSIVAEKDGFIVSKFEYFFSQAGSFKVKAYFKPKGGKAFSFKIFSIDVTKTQAEIDKPVYERNDYEKIILISDLHVSADSSPLSAGKADPAVMEAKNDLANDVNAMDDVKTVFFLGDLLAGRGSADDLQAAKAYVSTIKKKTFQMAGNHDFYYVEKGKTGKTTEQLRQEKLQAFRKAFEMDSLNYCLEENGILLILLSITSVSSDYMTAINEETLQWLSDTLAKNRDKPVVIFYHAPLLGGMSEVNPSFRSERYYAQPSAKLAEILNKNPQVMLWVSGHLHASPKSKGFFETNRNTLTPSVTTIHNQDADRRSIITTHLLIFRDKIVVQLYSHTENRYIPEYERVFPVRR